MVLALLIAAAVVLLWVRNQTTPVPTDRMHCARCETVAVPVVQTPGSSAIEVLLWLFLLLPGLCYTLWRVSSRRLVCPSCGSADLVPTDSPRAQRVRGA